MLLITPSEVFAIAFAHDIQLDNSAIRPSKIDIAQETFLRPKLGNTLLEALAAGEKAEFTDRYIKPPLAYYIKYGVLDELAVTVDPSGVIVRLGNSVNAISKTQNNTQNSSKATDSQLKTSDNEIQTVLQQTNNDITTIVQKAYHNDVDEETINKTQTTAPPVSSMSTITTDSERSLFISKNIEADDKKTLEATESSTNTKTENLSVDTNSQKEVESTNATDISKNDTTQNLQFRPASTPQIQLLKARALSDANILLRKALRYIQANPDQFPGFAIPERPIF